MAKKLSPGVFLYAAGSPPPEIPANAISLPALPDSVFGDGSHPTTCLCAGAVDLICRQESPSQILDVGTGTGVLARIARARGVKNSVATDIDPEALVSARAHVAMDTIPGEILVSSELPDHWGAHFGLVVANILEGPLRDLSGNLSRALLPGGALLISGFTPLQSHALHTVFTGLGLEHVSESHLNGWALLLFRRRN